MKRRLTFVTCGLALLVTGCLHPMYGPNSVPRDRAAYSSGLADSWKEQMLLNIVKLRYVDAPTFVGHRQYRGELYAVGRRYGGWHGRIGRE